MDASPVLRPIVLSDVAPVAALERGAGLPLRSLEARCRELDDPRTQSVVVAAGDAIMGSPSLWLAPDLAHVTTMVVAPEQRRRGYGRLLLDALFAIAEAGRAEAVTLECRVSNASARAVRHPRLRRGRRASALLRRW